jgi:exodeoxyribonuclease V alpha subunit
VVVMDPLDKALAILNRDESAAMPPHIETGLKRWLDELKIDYNKLSFAYADPRSFIAANATRLRSQKKNFSIFDYWGNIEKFSPEIFILLGWGFKAKESTRALSHLVSERILISDILVNPYLLIGGKLAFGKVDTAAMAIGVARDDPNRIIGYTRALLNKISSDGHLCLPLTLVIEKINADLDLNLDAATIQATLTSTAAVVVDKGSVYAAWAYAVENNSALMLQDFIYPRNDLPNVEELLTRYQKKLDINLSEMQKEAVRLACGNNMFILTGLPGTGKTTLTKLLCSIFSEELHQTPLLLTPTGVSARNLEEVAHLSAYTIHKALGFRGVTWEYGEHHKYSTPIVIVDEFSMVDMLVFYHLVSALNVTTRFICIGDAAQLPSVGPGNVLRELIGSKQIPTVALTEIFRQTEASDIIVNAHNVNNGKALVKYHDPSDFVFLYENDHARIKENILKMAQKLYDDGKEFQVISPMYAGVLGVDALNNDLKDLLNPPDAMKREMWLNNIRFRENDRIIVTKNSYKLDVFNGDVGKIKTIDFGKNRLTVKLFKPLRYVELEINSKGLEEIELKLAYCITVHKTQGLEFAYVILPLVMGFYPLLQRNLLYTAVTRARHKMILLGEQRAVTRAIANNQITRRNTFLGQRIIDLKK